MKIDYQSIAQHMIASHGGDSICVFYETIKQYDLQHTFHTDNGYCVYNESSLSFPIEFLCERDIEDIDVFKLLWQIVIHTKDIRSIFLYILSLQMHEECVTYKSVCNIKRMITDIVVTPPKIVDLMRAGRCDLQYIVSTSIHYLMCRLNGFRAVNNFIECSIQGEWNVYKGTIFYQHLVFACVHSAVVCKELLPSQTGSICVDGNGKLLMCDRDHRLLALVLLFSDKFAYVKKPMPECHRLGVPVQLSYNLRKKFPFVFNTEKVDALQHFSEN